MKKKHITITILSAIILIALTILTLEILYPPTCRIDEFTADGYNVRTLKLNNGFCLSAVYWTDKPLSLQQINMLLEENREKGEWLQAREDDFYKRWKRTDDGAEATYRKLDYKLCIFTKQLTEWREKNKSDKQAMDLYIRAVE